MPSLPTKLFNKGLKNSDHLKIRTCIAATFPFKTDTYLKTHYE